MTTFHQKHAILASLESLDQTQTEKVLSYIKSLMSSSKDEVTHQKLKREALKEIRQALGKEHKFGTAF